MNKKELIKITSVFLVFIFSYTCLVAILNSNQLTAQSILTTIPIGPEAGNGLDPKGLGVNVSTNRIYVANFGSANVSVIDTETNKVIDTIAIAVGNNPLAVGINPITNRIYVTHRHTPDGISTVTVIDGETNRIINNIGGWNSTLPSVGVNPETNRIYVPVQGEDSVIVIDGDTNEVIDTIRVGFGTFPFLVGINPETNRIYVNRIGDITHRDAISVIDGETNRIIDIVRVGDHPNALGVNPKTNRIYVVKATDNTVSVIDGETNLLIDTIKVGNGNDLIAVNPTTNRIYVSNHFFNTVSIIDGFTNQVIETTTFGGKLSAFGINPATNRIYASSSNGSVILIVDGNTNQVIDSIIIGVSLKAVGVNLTTNRIYIVNGTDSITIIEGETNQVIGNAKVGNFPEKIAVNSATNMIYLTSTIIGLDGRFDDIITVVDGETNNVIDTFKSEGDIDGIEVNPETNRIYVIAFDKINLTIIDGETNQVIDTVNRPVSINRKGFTVSQGLAAINPTTNRIYLAGGFFIGRLAFGVVRVIDGNDNMIIDTINIKKNLFISKSAREYHETNTIYLSDNLNSRFNENHSLRELRVIDNKNNFDINADIDLPIIISAPNAVDINPITNRVYVIDEKNDALIVIDGETNEVVDAVKLRPDGPGERFFRFFRKVKVNPTTNHIYIINNNINDNSVSIIDGNTREVINTIAVGDPPASIGVNPVTNRIYVTSFNSDSVTVIQDD